MKQDHIQDALIDLLLKVPVFQNRESRDTLLIGLDELGTSIGRSNVAVADIMGIVSSLEAIGQLDTGEWPLQILMRNARRYCPESTNSGRRLKELLMKYESSYNSQQIDQLPEIVIGTDERLPIAFLEKALGAQKAVARLLVPRFHNGQPMGKPAEAVTGTAWIIGPGLLLTNHHVIEARFPGETPTSDTDLRAQALEAVAWLGYNHWNAAHSDYRSVQLVQTNRQLDYALLRMEDHPLNGAVLLSEWGRLSLAKARPSLEKGARLNIIQHPRGEEKRLAIRSNFYVGRTSTSEEPARIQYLTDTEPGASGAPVCDDHWQVIAMHHAAIRVPDSQYKGEVVKYNNQGIEITAILDDLRKDVRAQIADTLDK